MKPLNTAYQDQMLEIVERMPKAKRIHEVYPRPCDNLLNANIIMGVYNYVIHQTPYQALYVKLVKKWLCNPSKSQRTNKI